jgi:3-oxoadipate enol-lactonase
MHTATLGNYVIHYQDAGQGVPLLLIHGLAGDHSGWAAQLPVWSAKYRVIAPDTRGAGASTQVDEPVTIEALADDFVALTDRLGLERFHVVGRSMGGCIGQWLALKRPERVLSLTLLASCGKFDPLAVRALENMREILELTGSWATHARHSIQNFVSHRFFNTQPERIAAIERLIGSSDRLQACYIEQNKAVLRHDLLDRLHEIACPVLVMSGGRDPLGGPLLTRWMLERLRHAEHVEFTESSHFFLMEEPERFMAVMDDWLARHTPRDIAAAAH